jgi:hypothetical protein
MPPLGRLRRAIYVICSSMSRKDFLRQWTSFNFHSLALASRLWHHEAMIGKGKRRRDPNQLVAWTVAVSTGQILSPEPEVPKVTGSAPPSSISEYMSAIGRKGGQIGGKRRLKTMTRAERSKVAAMAAKARWKTAGRCQGLPHPVAHNASTYDQATKHQSRNEHRLAPDHSPHGRNPNGCC